MDPCLIIKRSKRSLDGIVLIQVDDRLAFGTQDFLRSEKEAANKFKSKPRVLLTETATVFNSICIRKMGDGIITVNQQYKIDSFRVLETERHLRASEQKSSMSV